MKNQKNWISILLLLILLRRLQYLELFSQHVDLLCVSWVFVGAELLQEKLTFPSQSMEAFSSVSNTAYFVWFLAMRALVSGGMRPVSKRRGNLIVIQIYLQKQY